MDNDYVIIKKTKLPQGYNEVLKAKDLINSEGKSVSDACKMVNICLLYTSPSPRDTR